MGFSASESLVELRFLPLKNTKASCISRQRYTFLGHTCIITDFYTAMKQVVDYFLSQGMDRIGILTGLEETTDQEEIIQDKRLENFKTTVKRGNLS